MLRQFLLQVWHLFRFNQSYAQDGEDIIFEEFWIAAYGRKKAGFYVEIGGYHPVRFSNTYRLYRKGWRGVIVEPTPGKKRLFRLMRKQDTFAPFAAGSTQEKKYLYCFPESALNRILTEKEHYQRRQTNAKIITIRQETTAQILNRTVPEGTSIDLMSIDVEGFEMSVLEGNDWNKYAPKFILIEDDDFEMTAPEKSETFRFLTEKGYEPIARTRRNVLYHNPRQLPSR